MSRRKLAKAKAKRVSTARAAQAAKHQALEAKELLISEPKGRLDRIFSLKGLREGLLTFGAIAGVFCMLLAVAALAFDIKPVIFRSGSMSPAINTGALAISQTVKAKDMQVGDVVTVKTDSGVRVTHRIQNVTLVDGHATLVLKGDANKAVDQDPYVVESADRVLFDIPKAGYVASWLSGPIGIFAGGLLVGLLLLIAFGQNTRN
ncbi:MAG: signal peptidase I, partial [Aeromicrobium sp.]